jgi:hypothetical protein
MRAEYCAHTNNLKLKILLLVAVGSLPIDHSTLKNPFSIKLTHIHVSAIYGTDATGHWLVDTLLWLGGGDYYYSLDY